ncbi:MAG: hypothetical protein A2848_00220 [Candidatus Magasanikbacteria bacterium RIFCSPHIGHO2_01_FULL_50_8]|uniref:Uncharacterized protein n=2 Tax=Candidatus Magasanikiibacteriota TaxID=1752731 RepID=A0A1F6LN02_9BACT|nr:MAG: hypothetical protein A2848_00220 [Candidatus Magasanikbacteria bacterium RIFCSPHIGHO2_01_FULL_50_8]OGH68119.1 MAG: hypothetical protein A3C15_03345 [Candidatus Magasanikbacteria bacterium RIFCSPHIGHO2_02_FULL_50_9b]
MNQPQPKQPQPPQLDPLSKFQMKFSSMRMMIGSVVGVIAFIIICVQVYRMQGLGGLGQTVASWFGIRMY